MTTFAGSAASGRMSRSAFRMNQRMMALDAPFTLPRPSASSVAMRETSRMWCCFASSPVLAGPLGEVAIPTPRSFPPAMKPTPTKKPR